MSEVLVTEKTPPAGSDTGNNRVRYRAFDVIAASEDDARAVLRAEKGVFRGCVYENHQGQQIDTWLVCQNLTVRTRCPAPVGGTGLYEIIAEYAWHSASFSVARRPPLITGRARLRIEEEHAQIPITNTPDGAPIVNTVGEPPDVTMPVVSEVIHLEWIIAAANWLTAFLQYRPFRGKTNASDWGLLGCQAECAFCESIAIEPSPNLHPLAPMQRYFTCRASFRYLPPVPIGSETVPGFWFYSLNWGRRLRVSAGSDAFKELVDDGGRPLDKAILNEAGTAIDATKSTWYKARRIPTADFNTLNLQLDWEQ